MIIENVKVYTEDQRFKDGTILIRDGVFERIMIGSNEEKALDVQDET